MYTTIYLLYIAYCICVYLGQCGGIFRKQLLRHSRKGTHIFPLMDCQMRMPEYFISFLVFVEFLGEGTLRGFLYRVSGGLFVLDLDLFGDVLRIVPWHSSPSRLVSFGRRLLVHFFQASWSVANPSCLLQYTWTSRWKLVDKWLGSMGYNLPTYKW